MVKWFNSEGRIILCVDKTIESEDLICLECKKQIKNEEPFFIIKANTMFKQRYDKKTAIHLICLLKAAKKESKKLFETIIAELI
jgi:predicted NAD/FAD-dependent oxidoreductase